DRPGELARLTRLLGEAGVNIKDLEVLAIRDAGGAIRVGFSAPEELAEAQRVLSDAGYPVRQRGEDAPGR
ncbi:MAG TPA: ACT domain-containing protein, partial [Deinococcales bacterium]|nr:ACT domain-containing protein [Deinococcales bacterium]